MKIKIGKLTIELSITIEKTYMGQVRDALLAERKLEAVKIYKNATGLGLRESKAAVDEMEMDIIMKRKKVRNDIAEFQAKQFNK